MILNIIACKVVNCHQKGICFVMEIREASHTPINPLHTTHNLYIPRSSILTKKQSAWALLSTKSGTFSSKSLLLAKRHERWKRGDQPYQFRSWELTSVCKWHIWCKYPFWTPLCGVEVDLLVGENEVLAECPLGPISVPSSRRIIGTMLAQDNVRGFQRFYSTRNLIQFLERPRSPQGRKEQ